MKTTEFSSSSSPSDRRVGALLRHLTAGTDSPSTDRLSSVIASPTSEVSSGSVFAHLVQAPEDPILGMTIAYNKDPSPIKLNLGIGAYRTEEGKPLVLNVVRKAEQQLINDSSRVKEYLPIVGLFLSDWWFFTYAWLSPAIRENRRTIYITQPTWANHPKISTLEQAGLSVKTYHYYDPSTRGLNFQGLLEDIGDAPPGSIVLLHACAHNPTGVDPTLEQWEQIRKLMRSKGLMPFFDSAYQGFASGSLDTDAKPIRMFVAYGGECLVAQSYAKNMGLYGERRDTGRVESQLKLVIRPMYSNPPIHGASIMAVILRDRNLFNEWTLELKAMADHIISMRKQLFEAHIIKQIGMFTFTGLNSAQVSFMTKEYHVYMTSDGRISMAGLSSKTVPHLADSIHAAVTKHV
ncbi:hypothetical protein Bca52824_050838 [Brassica carinata]|uniref:Aminotransferase class I/classII large domain-containing protein n=1 Tax=Brassica carinata TaxID=52824 RepID=A0A8X7R4D5_BRACI|nr:hypothetical protein Bca52824_050838 [Brassica carinata]